MEEMTCSPIARNDLVIGIEDRMSWWEYFFYGMQHVLLESSSLAYPVAIGMGLNLPKETIAYLVQAYLLSAGIVTITQSTKLLKLPIVQGPCVVFIPILIAVGEKAGLGAAWTAMVIGGLLCALLSWPLSCWGKLRSILAAPPIYGPLVTLIGLSLAGVAINLIIGKPGTPSFGNPVNFSAAALTFLTVVVLTLYFQKGVLRFGAILIAVAAGTIWSIGFSDVDFSQIARTQWFALPKPFPFGWEIDPGAILMIFVGYIVAVVESIGNYIIVGEMIGRQKIDNARINRGILCESVGSALAAMFGGSGTTSYAQNIGAITITGVGSRHVITMAGAIFVILSLIPKVGAIVASIPPAVLGGVFILTWGMLIMQGIRAIGSMRFSDVNMIVAGSSLIIGMGSYFIPRSVVDSMPAAGRALIANGLIVGTFVGILLFTFFKILLKLEDREKKK